MSTDKEKTEIKKLNAEALESVVAPISYKADGQEVKLTPTIVKKFIANNASITDVEYKMFVELCKARQLNPFLGEAYLIKYSADQAATMVVGKDAILKRAIRHPKFDGREQGIIVLRDSEVVFLKGTFKLADDKIVGGWAKVYRKDWKYPVEITVSLEEVQQTKKDGSANTNWKNKTATMVEKVALVRALRESFVEELGGMYDRDEAWNNDDLNKVGHNTEQQPEPGPEKPGSVTVIVPGDDEKPNIKDI